MSQVISTSTTLGELEALLKVLHVESIRVHALPAKDPHRFTIDGFVTTPSKSLCYVSIQTSTESFAAAVGEWVARARETATGMVVVPAEEPKR